MKRLIIGTLLYSLSVQCSFAQSIDANAAPVQNADNSNYQVLEVQYNKNETYYIRQVGQNGKLAQITYPWQTTGSAAPQQLQQLGQNQNQNQDQDQRAQNQQPQQQEQVVANENRGPLTFRGSDLRF